MPLLLLLRFAVSDAVSPAVVPLELSPLAERPEVAIVVVLVVLVGVVVVVELLSEDFRPSIAQRTFSLSRRLSALFWLSSSSSLLFLLPSRGLH